jgi:hypothetical protein
MDESFHGHLRMWPELSVSGDTGPAERGMARPPENGHGRALKFYLRSVRACLTLARISDIGVDRRQSPNITGYGLNLKKRRKLTSIRAWCIFGTLNSVFNSRFFK